MLWAFLLSLTLANPAVTGVVKDSTGGTVSGATVILRSSSGAEQRTVTGPDGSFSFPNAPEVPGTTVIVLAGGFAEASQTISGSQPLEIVLALPKFPDSVIVTPTRSGQRLGNVPASVDVIDRQDIQQSPAVIADDVLRQIPTFSLFRRTSAISANPTAQGVSLRGIGPSGVSRTLVLIDNVPVNDPFGGWVFWTKVPLEDVDRIEIVNGSSSSLYGNYAMGGVINIVSRRPTKRTFEIRPQYGSRSSPKLDVYGSDVWGKVGVAVNGSVFDTDGFKQVIGNEQGPVDTKARVEFKNFNVKLDYAPTATVSAFLRTGYFSEKRDNAKVSTADGTPVGNNNGTREKNDTIWKSLNGGARILLPDQSDLQATVFYDDEKYNQNFLAISTVAGAPRAGGRVTVNQTVPTKNTGGMVQWSKAVRTQHYFTAGTDWRLVKANSLEDNMDTVTGTTVLTKRNSGGRQTSLGAFAQDVFMPTPRVTITLSARVDRWRNFEGHNRLLNPDGSSAVGDTPTLPDRDDTVGSPRVAALYHLTNRVSVWGDMNWGFRAPTLNELYRQFSIGSNPRRLTLANNNLGPEHLRGGEAGVSTTLPRNVVARATWFDNRIKDPVSSLVLTTTTALVTFQRTNLGRTKIQGIQLDAESRIGEWLKVSGAYLYNQAKVTENSSDTSLVGKYLAQVPKHRGSLQVAYTNAKYLNVGLGIQFIGRQFDDDANVATVPGETKPGLPGYATVDLTASRSIARNLDVFFGVQNLTDKEYIVQTAPTTIGAPRLVTGGLRIRFSGR